MNGQNRDNRQWPGYEDKNADRPGRNVEEILEDYAGRVPAEEWDRLPPDLIERLDHYTSGADV